jgi:hypothetical protein
MKNERENKEWLNKYPTLSKVNPANPFKVPVGYFDEMEGRIMENIRLQDFKEAHPGDGFSVPANYFDELSSNISSRVAIEQGLGTNEGYKVPENYFDGLTQNITSRIAIEELLNTETGFRVPENYFEDMAHNIHSRIAIEEILSGDKGFVVPENYFDELTENIQARVAVEELMEAETGFSIPENYFEGLEARILQQTVGAAASVPAKQQIGVVRKLWANAAFKYATAACFSIFVGTAVMMSEFNDKAIHNRSDLHKALSKVSKSDMESYLELTGDATSTVMENTDPDNLNVLSADDSTPAKVN